MTKFARIFFVLQCIFPSYINLCLMLGQSGLVSTNVSSELCVLLRVFLSCSTFDITGMRKLLASLKWHNIKRHLFHHQFYTGNLWEYITSPRMKIFSKFSVWNSDVRPLAWYHVEGTWSVGVFKLGTAHWTQVTAISLKNPIDESSRLSHWIRISWIIQCWPGWGIQEQDQAEQELLTEGQEAHLHQEQS